MGAQSLRAWLLPEELTPEMALELSLLVTRHALGWLSGPVWERS